MRGNRQAAGAVVNWYLTLQSPLEVAVQGGILGVELEAELEAELGVAVESPFRSLISKFLMKTMTVRAIMSTRKMMAREGRNCQD